MAISLKSYLSQTYTGFTGSAGEGVAVGGTTGQILSKISNTDHDTGWGLIDFTSSNYDSAAALIKLRNATENDKAWITWFDSFGNKIAGITAHTLNPTGDIHDHFSIETADAAGALQTRFEVQHGADQVVIGTKSANFEFGAGNDVTYGSSAGLPVNVNHYNGDFFKWGTGSVGFGDKDWTTSGLRTGSKWEFYRSTTDATFLIHQDDGTGDSEVWLRTGTKDFELRNNGTEFQIIGENNVIVTINDNGLVNVTGNLQVTQNSSFVEVTETVYSLTGTNIDPANGTIQYKTLTANTTFTEALEDGQSITLRLSAGATYTVTWPTMTWVGGSAPTLTAEDVLVFWQEGTTVYGKYVGSVA